MKEADEQYFRRCLIDLIQEHMPWPFCDVSRHDDEGYQTAVVIVDSLLTRILGEFADIARTAKTAKRRTYPKQAQS